MRTNERRVKRGFVWLMLLIVTCGFLGSGVRQSGERYRVVRRGDTASYLAFKIYGAYDPIIDAILRQRNRHIANLDRIMVGDTLYFPVLQQASTAEKQAPQSEAPAQPVESLKTAAATAVLTYLDGEVLFRRSADSSFAAAQPNLIFHAGDQIRTGDKSRAELILDNKSVLRIDANAMLTIVELAYDANNALKAGFKFDLGEIWTRVRKLIGRPSKFELQFPTAIAGVQGTIYRSSVAADSSILLRVYEGTVQVQGGGAAFQRGQRPGQIAPPQQVLGPQQIPLETWIRLVRESQEIRVGPDGRPSQPRRFLPNDDRTPWVLWNRDRDRDFASQE